jgi:hypothetical protein
MQGFPFINRTSQDGAFRIAAVSGLLTGVAAGTSTAGHLFAMRWAPAAGGATSRQIAVISRLRARMVTIAGFTAAQEVGIDLSVLRTYTAAHTGGTAQDLTGNNQKKRSVMQSSIVADMRIGTTGALTAGTHTFDAQPIAQSVYAELAAAATVAKGAVELFMSTEDLDRHPLILANNEGICIRNTIAMGAGGTARLVVELEWLELERY